MNGIVPWPVALEVSALACRKPSQEERPFSCCWACSSCCTVSCRRALGYILQVPETATCGQIVLLLGKWVSRNHYATCLVFCKYMELVLCSLLACYRCIELRALKWPNRGCAPLRPGQGRALVTASELHASKALLAVLIAAMRAPGDGDVVTSLLLK